MTLPVWPEINYHPRHDGFSLDQIANPVLRTEMNAGTIRQRRKYTLRLAISRVSYIWTTDEVAAFLAFHASLGDGAARFTMPVWNGSTFVTRTVAIDQGLTPITDYAPGPPPLSVGSMTLRIENL